MSQSKSKCWYSNKLFTFLKIIVPLQTTAGSGYGSGGKAPAIKYVPLPHHDLPVLIYQSDNNPPIHVVHTPRPQSAPPPPQLPAYDSPVKKAYQVSVR